MAFFCANLEGSLTKILKISGTTNSQIFLDALFFLPKSQIIDTYFTTVQMKYDHEMKVRAEFWSNIHDQIYTRFKYLSGTQPKTMAERPKEDL